MKPRAVFATRSRSTSLLLSLLLVGVAVSGCATPNGYFIELRSKLREAATLQVELGDLRLGSRSVSAQSNSTFGPTRAVLPRAAIIKWQVAGREQFVEHVDLTSGKPSFFDSLIFEIADERAVVVYFEERDGFRRIRIPLNETSQQARQRTLDEKLLHAAALGQLDTVKSALTDGANIDYLFGQSHPTPVRFAANGAHIEVVDYLLQRGARITRNDLKSDLLSDRARRLGVSPQ
jgi:hypothetical protein